MEADNRGPADKRTGASYKEGIIQCLKQLEKSTGDGSFSSVLKQVEAETNTTRLFYMYQTLREIIAQDSGEDTSFTVSLPDGKLAKVKNLEEAMRFRK